MLRRLYHLLRYVLTLRGLHMLLCRVGLHRWVTTTTYWENGFDYPEHQYCRNLDCDVQRRWRRPWDGWKYYEYPL